MVSQLGTEVQGLKTALANSSVRLTNHELNRFIVMLLSYFYSDDVHYAGGEIN